jgi:hypothetical protein
VSLLLARVAPAAHAQFSVIDIAAVNQLVSQLQQLAALTHEALANSSQRFASLQ